MKATGTFIQGVCIVEPDVFRDARGYFFESWNRKVFEREVRPVDFVQDNESMSSYGVVRGLHYQAAPCTQAKLVRVIAGTVLDVAVDIRRGSPTYGRHVAVELSGENRRQLFIPRGFAHGFAVLSREAIFAYKCDHPYVPEAERGIAWNDPDLGINWRLEPGIRQLSPRDEHLPRLADIEPWEENA